MEVDLAEHKNSALIWAERKREQRRLRQAHKGDSPEKSSERHTPREGVIGTMLRISGVERESRFRQ